MPNGTDADRKRLQSLGLVGDYRFENLETYKARYRGERSDSELAATAVYGLPELYRDRIKDAKLVGCAGCYVTASLLALAPLLKQGLIVPKTAIIDAKSGASGRGRKAEVNLLLAEAEGSLGATVLPPPPHARNQQICSDLAGQDIKVQFTPHLIPMVRGILATVYSNLRDPGLVREDLITIFTAFYRNCPWVKVLPAGVYPQTKWACGENLCFIGVEVDPRTDRVIVMSAIDNLIKGQAGQGIQCMNLMMGWEETSGFPQLAFYP